MKNRLLLSLLVFLFSLGTLSAQLFKEAPAPKVHRIIEWAHYTQLENQKVHKWSEYEFRKDGKLILSFDIPADIESKYQYTNLGQLERLTTRQYEEENELSYAYKKNYYVEEWNTAMGKVKTFYYVNKKKQVIEVKGFFKIDDSKTYELTDRTIYTYDSRDSLIGTMKYQYNREKNKAIIYKAKTIYFYFPNNGKLELIREYDHRGKLHLSTEYEYDDEDRVASIHSWRGDVAISTLTKFVYLKGQLWQKVHSNEDDNITRYIYKDGLLIREKEFADDELIRISDFQYVYYD